MVLLLLKVRAWAEHRLDERFIGTNRLLKLKLKCDEEDVQELLDLGVNEYVVKAKNLERWAGWEWVEETKEYVRAYVERVPQSKVLWEEIGLNLQSEWSLPPPARTTHAVR